jgi:hypothetical protein
MTEKDEPILISEKGRSTNKENEWSTVSQNNDAPVDASSPSDRIIGPWYPEQNTFIRQHFSVQERWNSSSPISSQ